MEPKERRISVNGYQLAVLEWNPQGATKIIASHGWLDNAASFVRLAPLLLDCHVVALDLPGHGYSDHKPSQATYNIWDDLTDILAVTDQMGWAQFHLLGHSRGAIMSLLLATAMPERVLSVVMIDGLLPQPVEIADTSTQLGHFLKDNSKRKKASQSSFNSIDEAVAARCKAISMSEESATPIVERGLKEEVEGCFRWRSDPRLLNASAFKLTADHNQAILDSLAVPNLLLVTEEGVATYEYFRTLIPNNPQLNCQVFSGSHHFHMEQQVIDVASAINAFYRGLG